MAKRSLFYLPLHQLKGQPEAYPAAALSQLKRSIDHEKFQVMLPGCIATSVLGATCLVAQPAADWLKDTAVGASAGVVTGQILNNGSVVGNAVGGAAAGAAVGAAATGAVINF